MDDAKLTQFGVTIGGILEQGHFVISDTVS